MGVGRSKPEDEEATDGDIREDDSSPTEQLESTPDVTAASADDTIRQKELAQIDDTAEESDDSEQSSKASMDVENDKAIERKPGLIPFTTVPIDNSLADSLFEKSLVCGWLMKKTAFERRPTDRWCALYENYLYEFEDELGEMVLKEKVNLKGCLCYVDEGAQAAIIFMRTAHSTFLKCDHVIQTGLTPS